MEQSGVRISCAVEVKNCSFFLVSFLIATFCRCNWPVNATSHTCVEEVPNTKPVTTIWTISWNFSVSIYKKTFWGWATILRFWNGPGGKFPNLYLQKINVPQEEEDWLQNKNMKKMKWLGAGLPISNLAGKKSPTPKDWTEPIKKMPSHRLKMPSQPVWHKNIMDKPKTQAGTTTKLCVAINNMKQTKGSRICTTWTGWPKKPFWRPFTPQPLGKMQYWHSNTTENRKGGTDM